jgi:hypothetical protein
MQPVGGRCPVNKTKQKSGVLFELHILIQRSEINPKTVHS